jgi:hypothetical protein
MLEYSIKSPATYTEPKKASEVEGVRKMSHLSCSQFFHLCDEVEPSTKTFSVHPSTVEEKATEETQIDATTTELKGLVFGLLNTTETTSTTNAPTGLLTFAEC